MSVHRLYAAVSFCGSVKVGNHDDDFNTSGAWIEDQLTPFRPAVVMALPIEKLLGLLLARSSRLNCKTFSGGDQMLCKSPPTHMEGNVRRP